MNNCLVTTLKGSVSNDNLPRYARLEVLFYQKNAAIGDRTICVEGADGFESTEPITIYANGSVVEQDVRKGNLTPTSRYYLTFPDADGKLWIKSKYTITKLAHSDAKNGPGDSTSGVSAYIVDLSQLEYNTNLVSIYLEAPNLNGEFVPKYNLPNIIAWSTQGVISDLNGYRMDIGCLSESIGTTFINTQNNNNIYGDIAQLAKLTNLSTLYIQQTNVEGSLNALLDGMFSNGRTSGILEVGVNQKLTYNNEVLTYDKVQELNNGGQRYRVWFEFNASGWILVPHA